MLIHHKLYDSYKLYYCRGEADRGKGAFPLLQSHKQEELQDSASHQMQVTKKRTFQVLMPCQGGAGAGVSAGGAASVPPGRSGACTELKLFCPSRCQGGVARRASRGGLILSLEGNQSPPVLNQAMVLH